MSARLYSFMKKTADIRARFAKLFRIEKLRIHAYFSAHGRE